MYKFIHAADLHLDSPLRGIESYPDAPVERIRGASRRALDNLVELAIEEEVAFLLLAGDIYDDDWKDYNTGLFFAQRMGQLRDAGIEVFMVSGNHDAVSVVARGLRPPDNVHVFSTKAPHTLQLDHIGVAIHGQGYRLKDTRDDLAASYPPAETGLFNIGLLHTALAGRPGHQSYAPTTLDVLKSKGYHYWALGHVHQREVVCEEPWVVFPGNIQGRHIREAGAKGCSLVTVDEGRVTAVEHREIDVLRWHECRIGLTGCATQDDLFQTIRQHLEAAKGQADGLPLVLRLTLLGDTPLHAWLHREDRWSDECRYLAAGLGDVWLEKVRLKTRPADEFPASLEEGSPLARLFQAIKELDLSPDFCAQVPELAELTTRLPSDLTGGEEPFDPASPEMQAEVRELLLARLHGPGRGA